MTRYWMWGAMMLVSLAGGACMALSADDRVAPFATTTAAQDEIVIFAASSLTDAVSELAETFEATHPEVTVVTNYGGSAGLAAQLLEGARADLFAPANQTQMGAIADAGLLAGGPRIFATNQLAALVPIDNSAGVESFADLANAGVRLVLAVPGVPVRDYADAMIASLAEDPLYGEPFRDAFYANLASEEVNVRQVAAKVALGEADAGIVYISDVTPEIADKVRRIPLPSAHLQPVAYPIARLANGGGSTHAQAFIDHILSDEGQAILQRWGFGPGIE